MIILRHIITLLMTLIYNKIIYNLIILLIVYNNFKTLSIKLTRISNFNIYYQH
jgi:hypothetical protein